MSKQTGHSPAQPAEAPREATLESLSCLVDGELDATHCTGLLQKLCSDPHARRQWTLMHIAGDALRSSDVASLHSESFVARVSTALAAEPAIVAPRSRHEQSFVRRVALPGVAAAAAASVLVFVAVPQLRDPAAGTGTVMSGTTSGATQGATAGKSLAASPQLASNVAEAETAPLPGKNGQVIVQRLPELDAYLAAHREQSGTAMLLRSTPYLRTSATVPR